DGAEPGAERHEVDERTDGQPEDALDRVDDRDRGLAGLSTTRAPVAERRERDGVAVTREALRQLAERHAALAQGVGEARREYIRPRIPACHALLLRRDGAVVSADEESISDPARSRRRHGHARGSGPGGAHDEQPARDPFSRSVSVRSVAYAASGDELRAPPEAPFPNFTRAYAIRPPLPGIRAPRPQSKERVFTGRRGVKLGRTTRRAERNPRP